MWSVEVSECRGSITAYEKAVKLRSATIDQIHKESGASFEEVLLAVGASSGVEEVAGPGLEVFGGVAHIPIKGILLSKPDPILALFGIEFSDYESIAEAVQAAESDSDVEEIVFHVNSPGGLVEGMFAAADIIADASKPTRAIVENVAASAAYFLASQSGRIEASSRSDRFGSVGVAVDIHVSGDVVSIASSNAPNKRPDVTTDKGRDIVQAQLDQMETIFIEAIARGRSTTPDGVKENFGKGGLLLAGLAIEAGMIDAIAEGQTQEMSPNDTQVSGVRAALGLDKNTDREDLVRACIQVKNKADSFDELQAKHDQQIALYEAAKDQLAKAQGTIDELQAKDKKREEAVFTTRRDRVINAALEENKILPPEVEHYTKMAKDEAGLKQLEELFAITAPRGMTEVKSPANSPKGSIGPEMTAEQYAKTYRCTIEEAQNRIAEREAKKQ